MDELARDYLISFYRTSLLLHGDRPEALRWSSTGQKARYSLFMEIDDAERLNGSKVLDCGCGKGDLYSFMKCKGLTVDYTGYDINPDLISLARSKYPECRFEALDVEETPPIEDFDYVFLCGVFNNRLDGVKEAMQNVLRTLYPHTRRALAVNALSLYEPEKASELNYVAPEELLSFAIKELSPYVALRLDRTPHDFTLFIYRKPRIPAE